MSWYGGINSPDDVTDCTPESYRFHSTFKGLVRMILAKVRTPQSWLDDMTGNMAVVRDIYYEYLRHEQQTVRNDAGLRGQQDRRTIISSAVPFSLAICNYDPNYTEVANWFLYQICMAYERGEFTFSPCHVFPECWYADDRGRSMPDYQQAIEFLTRQGVTIK